MSTEQASGGGIGLSGAVFIVFLILKLTGHIDWPWLWVAAPLWIPVALILPIVLVYVFFVNRWWRK